LAQPRDSLALVTPKDLAETLQVIIDKAPALRAAGVPTVTVGDLTFALEPLAVTPARTDDEKAEEQAAERVAASRGQGLDDASLYPGGTIPRRARPERT
jgi:hypothetical protein